MDERTSLQPDVSPAATACAASSQSANAAANQAKQPTYRAIFFDLDGTLLPMELEEFLGTYFKSIATFMGKHGIDVELFSTGLKAGTAAMATHDDNSTNSEAYWQAFFTHVPQDATDWDACITEFYEHDFGNIGCGVQPNPAVPRALKTLRDKGYPLVLATMPMFPPRAVEWRLNWAGADASSFARLTTYENSTSVKPKLDYYAENLAACGLKGNEVLMVGNNTVEDLDIMDLVADAFLVTDHLLDPVHYDLSRVKHGTLDQFSNWAETLPACEHPATDIEQGVVLSEARQTALKAALQATNKTASASSVAPTVQRTLEHVANRGE